MSDSALKMNLADLMQLNQRLIEDLAQSVHSVRTLDADMEDLASLQRSHVGTDEIRLATASGADAIAVLSSARILSRKIQDNVVAMREIIRRLPPE